VQLEGARFLVTGGSGFIGSHVVDRLLERGAAEVVVFDKVVRGENLEQGSDRVRVVEGDVTDAASVREASDGVDGVFHMAVLPLGPSVENPRLAHDVNVGGSLNVFEAARDAGARKVVYSSASSVYGDTEETTDESHPLNARTIYGATKLAAELYLRAFNDAYGLPYVTLRYMNVYGPRQEGGLVMAVTRRDLQRRLGRRGERARDHREARRDHGRLRDAAVRHVPARAHDAPRGHEHPREGEARLGGLDRARRGAARDGRVGALPVKVLVTGASGFIGAQLVPALAQAGHEVVALVRDPGRAPEGATIAVVDLSRPPELDALEPMDAIVHLAQANVRLPSGAAELVRVNTFGTGELLEWGRRTGAPRFVFASSGSIFGLGEGVVEETTTRRTDELYGVTKEIAERLVQSYARWYESTAILRPFAPYGPTQTGRVIPELVRRVRQGEPVTLNAGGRPRMTPLYVDDVVRAFCAALELDGDRVIHLAGDEAVSIRELAELIGDVLEREPVFDERDEVVGDLVSDNTRMREVLGVAELVPLGEGLRATALAGAPA
jgi:nucleoside-diphosphate-sugar epimerase